MMQLTPIKNRYISCYVKVINDQQIILHNDYDDNQYWLPFMRGTIWCHFLNDKEEPTPPKKKRKKKGAEKVELESGKYFLNSKSEPINYRKYVVLNPHQSILPFKEWRAIYDAYARRENDRDSLGILVDQTNPFKVSGWPGFELNSRGEPYQEESYINDRYEISDWCERFCSGMYIVENWNSKVQVTFQYKKDAVLFKLSKYWNRSR